jgi:hypothetical protein
MASSVRSRPNHYETLGLSTTASQDEVNRAFARIMGMFGLCSVPAAAQMSLAFEVLRDPAKRCAYDRALGLRPEPDPRHWTVAGVARSSPGFLGSAWGRLAEVAGDTAPRADPASESEPRPVAPAEPRLSSFIAASLREMASPDAPGGSPAPELPAEVQRDEKSNVGAEMDNRHFLPAPSADEESPPDLDGRPLDWKRPALVVAGLVAVAGVIGALAGLSVDDNEQPQSPERGIAVALPRATPRPGGAALSPAPVAPAVEQQGPAPLRVETSAPATGHKASPRRLTAFAEHQAEQPQLAESGGEATEPVGPATDQPAAEPVALPPAVAAALPLSNRVIARTIDRIGYSCGAVVSASAVEGAPSGVYRVTCSSGQTYEASPVHGRYHFRRSAAH